MKKMEMQCKFKFIKRWIGNQSRDWRNFSKLKEKIYFIFYFILFLLIQNRQQTHD